MGQRKWSDVENALSHIDARDRDVWIRVGMAVKREFGEEGFALWDRWSQSAPNYEPKAARAAWKSFKAEGPVTAGTIFYYAKQGGYAFERKGRAGANGAKGAKGANGAFGSWAFSALSPKLRARKIWEAAEQADLSHPYLRKKGLEGCEILSGLRQSKGKLIAPIYEALGGEIVSLQTIDASGKKMFAKACPIAGNGYCLGKAQDGEVYLAEGLATAATVTMCAGVGAVVAFNAGNMAPAARSLAAALKTLAPSARPKASIAADNDWGGAGFEGARRARDLLESEGIEARIVMPRFDEIDARRMGFDGKTGKPPSDFNDLLLLRGPDAVREQLSSGRIEHVKDSLSRLVGA